METYNVFLDLAVILFFAKVFGILARKCKAPQVVGQILAGLFVGPCVLGWISQTEFITQMAQFSQLQYLQDSSSYSMSNYASSLVGKTVTVSKMDGTEKVNTTGVVTEVKKVGDEFKIVVNGVNFDLKSIQSIADTNTVSKPTDNTNIGELITKASLMIGLYAHA